MQLLRGYTDNGTFGDLVLDGEKLCEVLERPWLDNKPFESCIPEGEYIMQWYDSPKFGRTIALTGGTVSLSKSTTHARYGVLMHIANRVSELEGCLAPGSRLGVLGREWAVMASGDAMRRLKPILEREIAEGRNILVITHKTAY